MNPFEKFPGKIEKTCPKCYGKKEIDGKKCNTCLGTGTVTNK